MSSTIEQIIQKLRQLKIVPVIAIDEVQDILPLCETLSNNGLPIAEITFRSPVAVEAIRLLRESNPDILIAAGTVLTCEQVEQACEAGADVIVTPGINPNIVRYCQRVGIPIIPGVNNPMSIEAVLEMGLSTVKFFPAEASGGVNMIKALLGPYPQLQIMPTGGIGINNINDYFGISNVFACGGSWFVDKSLIQAKYWDLIGRLTQEAVLAVR